MEQNKDSQVISSSKLGEWVGYWEKDVAGESELELPEQYAILLVLEGEITLTFREHESKTIGKKSLVVIDRKKLTFCKWKAGTAMLEFTPPEKIFWFLASCNKAFQIPCSPIVPVRPKLQKWINDLMAERLQPKETLTEVRRRDFCMRLGNILQDYPPLLVGELFVPFHACSISGKMRCKGELCGTT